MLANVGLYSYGSALLTFGLLTLLISMARRKQISGLPAIAAALLTATWAGSVVYSSLQPYPLMMLMKSAEAARNAAWQRPDGVPIYAFTESEKVVNQMTLLYGVRPFFLDDDCDMTHQVEKAMRLMKNKGLIQPGQMIIAVSEIIQGDRPIETIQMQSVP